jgi:hypothetical protein
MVAAITRQERTILLLLNYWHRWLRRLTEPVGVGRAPRRFFRVIPNLEQLEPRLSPATTFSIADNSVIEPAPNGTVNLDFTVTRSGDTTSQVTVGYTTVAGTAQPKPPGADFTPVTGTVLFPSGAKTETISIPIFGNGVYNNPSLTFSVKLTNVVGGPVVFTPPTNFSAGTAPISVAVADLNGDGMPDLIVANQQSNSVSVLLNTTAPGAVTPTFANRVDFAVGNRPDSVAVADLNGDGKPDLVVANYNDNTVSVLLNTTTTGAATPTFAPKVDFATGTSPSSVAIGDLNGDGKPDIVVANRNNGAISVLLNNTPTGSAAISFTSYTNFTTGSGSGSGPTSVAIGDFNGDGKPDIVVANQFAYNVAVFINATAPGAATPTFAPRVDFTTQGPPNFVAVADFNGDGKPDIVFTSIGGDGGGAGASVLLNTTKTGAATPTFANPVNFAPGYQPRAVTVGDFNGDGRPDLAVANYGSNSVSVLLNTTATGAAAPTFAAAVDLAVGKGPRSVAVGDLNGDGRPDLAVANYGSAVANYGSNNVSVLLNAPGEITRPSATGTIIESDSPIVFLQQPGDGAVLQPIPPVVVQVLGQSTGAVTITVAPGSAGSLDSASTVSVPVDANGVAVFKNLILDAVGSYTLTASYGGQFSAASASFMASAVALNLLLNGSQVSSNVPTIVAGASFDLGASFIDQAAVPLQEIVAWGDGSVTQAPITVSNQQGQFDATHIYPSEGSFPVNVTIVDSQGRVVGVGALPGPVQVIPDSFGAVNVVYGVPGQTVTQSVADPSTGIIITISLTLPVGSAGGGYLLAAPLKSAAMPSVTGAPVRTSFDLRQFNLPPGATATVTITFSAGLPDGTTVQLLYLDTKTDPSHPVEKVFQGPVQPVRGNSVTFGLSQFTTPQLTDLSGTVFTVVATVPAQTATVAISPPLASNSPDATAAVQTAAFRTTSSLTLTLEPTQASQVSSGLSMFGTNTVGGGGGGDDEESAAAETLLQFLFDKLDFLPKFLFHGNAPAPGQSSDSPSPPATAPAAPDAVALAPSEPQQSLSALDLFLGDPAPSFDWFTPTAPVSDAPEVGRRPRIEHRNPAAFAAAAAAGLGLYVSGKEKRRKGGRSPAGKHK